MHEDPDAAELRAIAATVYGPISAAAQVHSRGLPVPMLDAKIAEAVDQALRVARRILDGSRQTLNGRALATVPVDEGAVSHLAQVVADHEARMRDPS